MGRRIGLSGDWLRRLLYASQLVALLCVLLVVALPLDSPASVVLAVRGVGGRDSVRPAANRDR